MNWKALKDGLCPKCGGRLEDSGLGNGNIPALACEHSRRKSDKTCDFKISEKRYKEIVAPKPRRSFEPEDNLAQWNNYGHEPHYQRGDIE